MAGYSQRSLEEKLGLKPGYLVAFFHAPRHYQASLKLSPDISVTSHARGGLDCLQYFATEKKALATDFPNLTRAIKPSGSVWVSWPKKSARVATDLNENSIRDIGLANGLVVVKVIAVDETWSGLKFVYSLKDRI